MKELRKRCKNCGERFTVIRFERERTSAYCDLCRAERQREQARIREELEGIRATGVAINRGETDPSAAALQSR